MLRQMEIYFDFIGEGRSELIEKDFTVEKCAANEGGSPSRAIKDGEDGGQNDADSLNDTYYFSKFRSKSSVSYRTPSIKLIINGICFRWRHLP